MRQVAGFGFLGLLWSVACYWYGLVNKEVRQPYLDEYFHVRQALEYWFHRWGVWDPKITTPPGLYLWSYAWLYVGYLVQFALPKDLELLDQLRFHNIIGLILVFVVIALLVVEPIDGNPKSSSRAYHLAFNVCLFPPLFFFCALYYTDIISALAVLRSHRSFRSSDQFGVFFFGLLSLTLRQTNIFWTAVYLGGLEAIRQCKRGKLGSEFLYGDGFLDIVQSSWRFGRLYDLPVGEAGLEDYLKTLLSLGTSAIALLPQLLTQLIPPVALLAAFSGFVVWNGGVVLGDKQNHIASIHLPQMLYIWPYIAFFSFPIILPSLLTPLLASLPASVITFLPQSFRPAKSGDSRFPRSTVFFSVLAVTVLVIRCNTIVHPFTLADNRHYTFYVFRLLLRHPLTKYLAGPVYIFLAWACIQALGGLVPTTAKRASQASQVTNSKRAIRDDPESARVSFVLLWLATCTLSLATAPLVEPRYFILPWIVWRLHIPLSSPSSIKSQGSSQGSWIDWAVLFLQRYSLWFETLWFLVVNAGTGYMFLRRGFGWPSEPGVVQRFMW